MTKGNKCDYTSIEQYKQFGSGVSHLLRAHGQPAQPRPAPATPAAAAAGGGGGGRVDLGREGADGGELAEAEGKDGEAAGDLARRQVLINHY